MNETTITIDDCPQKLKRAIEHELKHSKRKLLRITKLGSESSAIYQARFESETGTTLLNLIYYDDKNKVIYRYLISIPDVTDWLKDGNQDLRDSVIGTLREIGAI